MLGQFADYLRSINRRKSLRRIGDLQLSEAANVRSSIAFGPSVDASTNGLHLGPGSLLRGAVTFARDGACLSVGGNSAVNGQTLFSIADHIHIGSDVLISFECMLMDHDGHALAPALRAKDLPDLLAGRPKSWEVVKSAPITIEDSAWIGARAIILKGVCVGRGAVVAAGAVVHKSVPPFTIVAGNPACVVGRIGVDS